MLNIDIYETSAGLPTGASLASATFADSTSGLGGAYANFDIVFNSPATLDAGTQYALLIDAITAVPTITVTQVWSFVFSQFMPQVTTSPNYYMWSYGVDEAANGERLFNGPSAWTATASEDYYFATYMTATPPPTTAAASATATTTASVAQVAAEPAQLANTGNQTVPQLTLIALVTVFSGFTLSLHVLRKRRRRS